MIVELSRWNRIQAVVQVLLTALAVMYGEGAERHEKWKLKVPHRVKTNIYNC